MVRMPSCPRFLLTLLVLLGILSLPGAAKATPAVSGFSESIVTASLGPSTQMEFAPDGRLFVSEHAGRIRVIKNGMLLPTPFITLSNVDSESERGLMGIAFDPQFATNHWVYAYYTSTVGGSHNRVSRFTANGDVAVAGSETVITRFENLKYLVHISGALSFGPDGKLYVTHGDNGWPAKAQLLDNQWGKMHRFNKDGTIPTDNPFYNTTTGANRSIWAYGLRNPFTFAFQPGTGKLYINDVGQHTWEEINEGVAGANFGWPTVEGPSNDPRFSAPVYAYQHDLTDPNAVTGCSINGAAFYNPSVNRFPASFTGDYFFGDFCGKWVRNLDGTTRLPALFATRLGSLADLAVSSDGHLYILSRNEPNTGLSAVRRISYDAALPPSISQQPASQQVAVGQSATFSVSASGTPPLAYQWQRGGVDIAGATSATYTIPTTALSDDGGVFRVKVTNSISSVSSNNATLTVLNEHLPQATITTPTAGTTYRGGDTINYSGTGTDTEDGNLSPSAFTWKVDFHHDDHAHPFLPAVSGAASGSFTIPTVGETSDNVWYRIYLTVKDSAGFTHQVFRDVTPEKATVAMHSAPSGLQLTLDGQPMTTPFSFTGVIGIERQIGAPSPQAAAGKLWKFTGWSDGGAATHAITTPDGPQTFTATFEETTGAAFVGSSTAGKDTGRKGVSVPTPAGTVGGDVMVASVVLNDSLAVTAPAGWQLVRQDAITGALRQAIYTRVAASAEAPSHTWTTTDFRRLAAGISTYRGVSTTNPVDVQNATTDTTADTTATAPSITTTVPAATVLHFTAANLEGSVAAPAGMTSRWQAHAYNTGAARDSVAAAADMVQPTAGATGARDASLSAAGVHIGALVALRPAAAGPPPLPTGISVVASASAGVDTGAKVLTVPVPAGTAAGDVMVASIVVNDDDMPLAVPTGWTLVNQASIRGALRHAVFTRVAGGSEPAGYAWSVADHRRLTGGVTTYRGVSPSSPVNAQAFRIDTTPDTALDAPSITTTVAGARLVHLSAINAEGTITAPGGMTERWERHAYNAGAPRDALAAAADSTQTSAGATGSRTATASAPGVHISMLLALRPAG